MFGCLTFGMLNLVTVKPLMTQCVLANNGDICDICEIRCHDASRLLFCCAPYFWANAMTCHDYQMKPTPYNSYVWRGSATSFSTARAVHTVLGNWQQVSNRRPLEKNKKWPHPQPASNYSTSLEFINTAYKIHA